VTKIHHRNSLLTGLTAILISVVIPVGASAFSSASEAGAPTVAQLQAAVIPQSPGWIVQYLIFTMNSEEQSARATFEAKFQLNSAEKQALVNLAKRRSDAERTVRGHSTPAAAAAMNANADQELRLMAGDRYNEMINWLQQWYAQDIAMRSKQQIDHFKAQHAPQLPGVLARIFGVGRAAASDYSSLYVYQTQFGSSGWDGALPDYDLKYATLYQCCVSAPYSIQPYWFGASYNNVTFSQIYTKDVGPWNEDDNYWDLTHSGTNPRRCSPAPGTTYDSYPESEAALTYGFNGGLSCYESQSGGYQTVTNIAGIDLEPDIAQAFGLCAVYCNSWMTVTYTRNP